MFLWLQRVGREEICIPNWDQHLCSLTTVVMSSLRAKTGGAYVRFPAGKQPKIIKGLVNKGNAINQHPKILDPGSIIYDVIRIVLSKAWLKVQQQWHSDPDTHTESAYWEFPNCESVANVCHSLRLRDAACFLLLIILMWWCFHENGKLPVCILA